MKPIKLSTLFLYSAICLFIAFVILLISRIITGYTPLFWFYVVGSIGFMVLVALNGQIIKK